MTNQQIIKLCDMIEGDMEQDAKNFEGQPFTGKTVAEYFGYQGAAIAALARAIKEIATIPNEELIDNKS